MDLAYRTPEDEIAALRHALATVRAELGTAAVEIEHLRAQVAALRRQRKRELSPTVDVSGCHPARAATGSLQFHGRSSESLEARWPRASWSMV